MRNLVLIAVFVLTQLNHCCGRRRTTRPKPTRPTATGYLERYGYLHTGWDPDGRDGQQVKTAALRKFQRFAGIRVTGRMDAPTVKMLTSPRCGAKDYRSGVTSRVNGVPVTVHLRDMKRRKKRYLKEGSQWYKKTLTYSIHGKTSPSTKISSTDVVRALVRAFGMWQAASSLKFRRLRSGVEADIKISFESGYHKDPEPFDGKGGTIAHAFYPVSYRGYEGDIHFDDDEEWTVRGETGTTDFTWTSMHEIGHALGLDHSHNPQAIMWAWYRGYKSNVKLDQDDINGIQSIYGPPVTTRVSKAIIKGRSTICHQSNFDAVLYDSRTTNTYFFKGSYVWTMNKDRYAERQAVRISSMWPRLPSYIDAAYTNKAGSTIFFKNQRYWEYDRNKRLLRRAQPLSNYIRNIRKFPRLTKIDAAMVWDGKDRTYFFHGSRYWRYNGRTKTIDRGYPKSIATYWKNVRLPVQAVTGWQRQKTFFFNRDGIYRYDVKTNKALIKKYPRNKLSKFIKNCR